MNEKLNKNIGKLIEKLRSIDNVNYKAIMGLDGFVD